MTTTKSASRIASCRSVVLHTDAGSPFSRTMRRPNASMRRSLDSVGLMRANSLSHSAGVARISLMSVLQKTTLPAPIIAIFFGIRFSPVPRRPRPDYRAADKNRDSLLRAPEARPDRIEGGARRDEQGAPVLAAEGDVCRPGLIDIDVIDLPARAVEDRHPFPGEVEIPLLIEGHSVGSEFAQEPFRRGRTIGADVVCPRLSGADVGHVQYPAVGCSDDAVGLSHVVDYARNVFAVGGQPVGVLPVLFHGPPFPVGPLVHRIGEPDGVVGRDP